MRNNTSINFNNNGLVNNYYTQFLSGNDIDVFIDGVHLKEVTGISYQVQNNNVPYYGYDSKYFDYVFEGRSIVVGNILVAVNVPQFLYRVLSGLGYAYNTEEVNTQVTRLNNSNLTEEEILYILSATDIDDLDLDNNVNEGDFIMGRNFDLDIYTKGKDNKFNIKFKHMYINGYKSVMSGDDAVYETYEFICREVISKPIKED